LSFLINQFPPGPLILDASVIFNLLGCERPNEVLSALDVDCFIEQRTLAEIKRHPIEGASHKKALSSLQEGGHIHIHRMSTAEYEVYLRLVSGKPSESLGDGESAAIATSLGTAKPAILDDGKARKICNAHFPHLRFSSSLQLFLTAGARAGWPDEHVRSIIRAARKNARMNIVKGEESLFSSLGL